MRSQDRCRQEGSAPREISSKLVVTASSCRASGSFGASSARGFSRTGEHSANAVIWRASIHRSAHGPAELLPYLHLRCCSRQGEISSQDALKAHPVAEPGTFKLQVASMSSFLLKSLLQTLNSRKFSANNCTQGRWLGRQTRQSANAPRQWRRRPPAAAQQHALEHLRRPIARMLFVPHQYNQLLRTV